MANKKLSELSPLSAAPAGDDILAITDTSTTLTKKVTITELMESWATVEATHGTASIKNFGTSANELVSLDSNGKLPAVDGSQLTNISGGGSTAVMGSGNSYAAGLVLAGSATHADSFLRKDGTWATTLALGTTSSTALAGDTSLLALGTTSSTALAGDTTTISAGQASAITANTAKVTFPGFGTSAGTALEGDTSLLALGTTSSTALAGDTSLLALGTTSSTALAGDTTTISAGQASAITANTAKVTNVPVATDAIWDTVGDLAVASGANAASKLAIGTSGQVLTVNSGGTSPEWADASGGGGGGVSALTVNAQTGTTYTIVSGDLGKLVTFSNSSGITVTVPSGLGAGFYCYVQQLDEGQVNFLGTKNERNQTCLSKNALAMIASEAADEYVLSGDVTSFDNCITLVTDKKNATNYIAFDDGSGNYYMGNGSTDWGGDYGQLTGTALSGNYKLMQTSDMNTAVDNALGGSGASTPNVENGGYAMYNQEGNYDYYVYCGTGNTATSVNVVDGSSNSISIVPVLYRIKESSMQSIPIWGVTVYYDNSGSVYESYDSSGSNVNGEYALGWIDNPTPGKVYFGGHQSGSSVFGKSGSGTPEGYLYLD